MLIGKKGWWRLFHSTASTPIPCLMPDSLADRCLKTDSCVVFIHKSDRQAVGTSPYYLCQEDRYV